MNQLTGVGFSHAHRRCGGHRRRLRRRGPRLEPGPPPLPFATAGSGFEPGPRRNGGQPRRLSDFQIPGKGSGFARSGLVIALPGYAISGDTRPGKGPAIAISRLFLFYADDAMEAQMHIGSVLVAIWLVIGGIAAGARGDFTGPMGCSRAGTIAVTILAGPLNYAGVNPNIDCTVRHPSN